MEDLNRTYGSLLTDGSSLWYATDISPDGKYIVGWGCHALSGTIQEEICLIVYGEFQLPEHLLFWN